MRLLPLCRAAAVCGLVLGLSPARAVSIVSNASDAEINEDGTFGAQAGITLRVGASSTAGGGRNAIYVFALPTLGVGQSVNSASFSFALALLTGTPTFNTDLYGLTFGAASTPPSDYFEGSIDVTNATLIQNDLVMPTTTQNSTVTTSAGANAALVSYLNTQYTAGAGGNFVYLRASPDADAGLNAIGFNVSASENTTLTKPTLTFTTVPEPGSALLALSGGAALFIRRRRV